MNQISREFIYGLKRIVVLELGKLPLADAIVACEELGETTKAYRKGAKETLALIEGYAGEAELE